MDAVTALPSLARGMLDGITRRIGLTVGKGPPFVYLPSWVPTILIAFVFLLFINNVPNLASDVDATTNFMISYLMKILPLSVIV